MKLKAPTIEIPKEDPFRHDLLKRKGNAEMLTELLKSSDDPLVLCINARWGEGKTTFLKMWRQHLENANFKTIYFNAWENDFSDDALVSLIGEFESAIQALALGKNNENTLAAQIDTAKKFGVSLLKHAVPSAIKLATVGLLDLEKATEDALAQVAEKIAKDKIEQYEKAKKSVHGFKNALAELALELGKVDGSDKVLPLVIFVDELDRCRPDYAIEILEKVKHFFSVPNVVFLLAMDKQQMGCSIQTLYGAGLDVAGYLRRCIDIDYNLPKPNPKLFCRAQFLRYGLDSFFNKRHKYGELAYDRKNIEDLFITLFEALDCSLRDQEHCFSLLALAIRITPPNHHFYPWILSPLIVLKIKNPKLFAQFSSGECGIDAIFTYLKRTIKGTEFINTHPALILEAFLIFCLPNHDDVINKLSVTANPNANPPASQADRQRATTMLEIINKAKFEIVTNPMKYVLSKIDMTDDFAM